MKQQEQSDVLKTLAEFLLPPGVMTYFDVVDAEESDAKDDKLFKKELHVYLLERDNRTPGDSGATSNGYTEDKKLLDFPVRTHRMILHVRRRRWIREDGTAFLVDLKNRYELSHPGTRYSKEFALFLKRALG